MLRGPSRGPDGCHAGSSWTGRRCRAERFTPSKHGNGGKGIAAGRSAAFGRRESPIGAGKALLNSPELSIVRAVAVSAIRSGRAMASIGSIEFLSKGALCCFCLPVVKLHGGRQ